MDLLADLTPAQREAVTHVDGPLLVLAGAGSGKTRVITRRVAHLLHAGIAPEEHPGPDVHQQGGRRDAPADRGPGAGVRGLGRHVPRPLRPAAAELRPARRASIRGFTIYDQADRLRAVKDVDGSGSTSTAPTHHPRAGRGGHQPGQERPGQPPRCSRDRARDDNDRADRAGSSRPTRRSSSASSAVDFDDLLVHVVTILKDHPDVRATSTRRYRYVLVDEYQDTNLAQYAIVRALSVDHPNLCVTGDPDQSIYGWRGANLTNILEFEHDYPGCQVVKLERNYRSTKNILQRRRPPDPVQPQPQAQVADDREPAGASRSS